MVDALIHRDYIILGSEIHIDMYTDRLEIQSPGGMFEGKPIQEYDIDVIGSVRRNPIIADLFQQLRLYMPARSKSKSNIKTKKKLDNKKQEFFA